MKNGKTTTEISHVQDEKHEKTARNFLFKLSFETSWNEFRDIMAPFI